MDASKQNPKVQLETEEDVEALVQAVHSTIGTHDASLAQRIEHTVRRNVDAASATASRAEFLPFDCTANMSSAVGNSSDDGTLVSLASHARSLAQQLAEAREQNVQAVSSSVSHSLHNARPPNTPPAEFTQQVHKQVHAQLAERQAHASSSGVGDDAARQYERASSSLREIRSLLPSLEQDEQKLSRLTGEAEHALQQQQQQHQSHSKHDGSSDLNEALQETPGARDINRRRLSRMG